MDTVRQVTVAISAIGGALETASFFGFMAAGVVALFVMLAERILSLRLRNLQIERLRLEIERLCRREDAGDARQLKLFDPKDGTPVFPHP